MRPLRRTGCECCAPGCPQCGELAAFVAAIHNDFEQLTQQARVPTAEIVWWRAQMRARQEAARTATRPIMVTQAVALAALVGLLGSIASRLTLPDLPNFPFLSLAVAAGCSLVFVPLVVYFASEE